MYLFFPYQMQKTVVVCKSLKAEATYLDEGAVVNLTSSTRPVNLLLRRSYRKDKHCLKGDIAYLLSLSLSYIL